MTTTNIKTKSPHAPDESAKAARAIGAALAAGPHPISHHTARLIAAAINEGDDSPLEHFAATGQFDIELAGHEAQRVAIPTYQEPWRRALLAFLLSMRRQHPWKRAVPQRPQKSRTVPFADGEPGTPDGSEKAA